MLVHVYTSFFVKEVATALRAPGPCFPLSREGVKLPTSHAPNIACCSCAFCSHFTNPAVRVCCGVGVLNHQVTKIKRHRWW